MNLIPPIAAVVVAILCTQAVAQDAAGRPARTIIGLDVHGPGGTQVGEVEDLHVSPDGRVAMIVIDEEGRGEGKLAVPWAHAQIGPEVVVMADPRVLRREFGGPGVDGWSVAALHGAQVQVGLEPEWGVVRDTRIDPRGQVAGFVVSAAGGGDFVVPASAALVGPEAGYLKILIPEAQIATLERPEPGLSEPYLPPLGTTPDTIASPSKEQLEERLRQEVAEWQRRVADFAHQDGNPEQSEDLQRALRTLQLQYQNLRQLEGENFEAVLEQYEAARDQLAEEWRDTARQGSR